MYLTEAELAALTDHGDMTLLGLYLGSSPDNADEDHAVLDDDEILMINLTKGLNQE